MAAALLVSAGRPAAAGDAAPQPMPPHPNLLHRLQAEGYDSVTVLNLRRLAGQKRAMGIDQPRPISAPVTGTRPALVLLVDFTDRTHNAASTPTVYSTLLFSVGTYPAPGSMRDFCRSASYGQYDISPSLVDSAWRQASQNHTYYANHDGVAGTDDDYGMGDTYPYNAQRLVEEAVDLADAAGVNFASYAVAGQVQGLFVIHAGPGGEATGNPDDIWSHQWALNAHAKTVDGVVANTYSIEPEYTYSPGDSTVGIFCHEYGHVIGLPDLYDYDGSSAGLGDWSLMAGGSWNGPGWNGSSPAFPDAYCRLLLGWVTPQVPSSFVAGASLAAVETTPTIYQLWTSGSIGTEYFLLENRQKTGFDQYVPGPGLLLYHVDETMWSTGNDNEWHPLVMLEQADGWWDLQTYYNSGDDGDPFPGSANKRSVNGSTVPDTDSYAGAATQVSVSSISDSAPTMTADIAVLTPTVGTGIPITNDPEKYQSQPAADGYEILWSDGRDANYGIARYDMATGQSRWVAQGSFTQVLSAVSGDYVTWLEDRAGTWQFHTVLRDLSDDYEFQVSQYATPSTDPSLLWPPAADGSLIVYTEPNGSSFDLYLYDLSVDSNGNGLPNWREPVPPDPDFARRALVTGSGSRKWPKISGRRIVWVDTRNGNNDIYLYDLDLDQQFPLCTNVDIQESPDISGDHTVWTDYRSGNGDIYLYDLSVDSDGDGTPNWRESPRPNPDPAERNISAEAHRQSNPSIDGRLVVWEDDRYGGDTGTDVCLYDLLADTTTWVTKDVWDQTRPVVSSGLVAWQDNSLGNADIYAWASPLYYGALAGSVKDGVSGATIAGAVVTCGGITRASLSDGAFLMPVVPTGAAQVATATAGGYHQGQVVVDIIGGDTASAQFLLTPLGFGSIGGTVTDAHTSAPLAGATITCGARTAVTGASGAYSMSVAPGSGLTVSATAAGYVPQLATGVTVADGATSTINFVMDPDVGAVTGKVTDAVTGSPVAGALATCAGRAAVTTADGAYELTNVPTGSGYTLTVTATGYAPWSQPGVAVTFDQTTVVDAQLAPLVGSIAGAVTATVTGMPIVGANVTCGALGVTTDATGRYRFDALLVGSGYSITVTAAGYTPSTVSGITVLWNQVITVNVELVSLATGSIAGMVTNAADSTPIANAAVNCGAASARTGADGSYTLSGIPVGSGYRAGASAGGYYWASATGVSVADGQTTRQDFALTRLPKMTGSHFEEINSRLGLPPCAGAAWGDCDDDGYPDLFLTSVLWSPHAPKLYHNNGNLTFSDVSAAKGLPDSTELHDGVAWADYNNDGLLDVLSSGDSGVSTQLFRNDGASFLNVASAVGLTTTGPGRTVGWCDYDGDSRLDVVICYTGSGNAAHLYHQEADGRFTDVTVQAGLTGAAAPAEAFGCAWGDYDNDGRPDLMITRPNGRPLLYHNNGNGTFTEMGATSFGSISGALTVAVADYDNDGWLDHCLTGQSGAYVMHNNGDGTFTNASGQSGMVATSGEGGSIAWADYDNDGYVDLFVGSWDTDRTFLYHNTGDGVFTDVTSTEGVGGNDRDTAAVWADVDLDGRLDLYEGGRTTARFFHNIGNTGNWLRVRALTSATGDATDASTPTRDAMGARVELNVDDDETFPPTRTLTRLIDGGSGFLGQNEPVAQFGVPTDGPVAVRVVFPDGSVVMHRDVAVNQQIIIRDVPADRTQLFSDVPLDHWAYDSIRAVVNATIAGGYSDGTYRPTLAVTRDQMAVYISRAVKGGDSAVPAPTGPPSFPDVPSSYWAFKYVECAKASSIVAGYLDGTYQPTIPLDRGQMAVFVARAIAKGDDLVTDGPAAPSFPDVPTTFWAYKYVEYIKSRNVTSGYLDGLYHPEYTCTRDQMAVYVARAFGF